MSSSRARAGRSTTRPASGCAPSATPTDAGASGAPEVLALGGIGAKVVAFAGAVLPLERLHEGGVDDGSDVDAKWVRSHQLRHGRALRKAAALDGRQQAPPGQIGGYRDSRDVEDGRHDVRELDDLIETRPTFPPERRNDD